MDLSGLPSMEHSFDVDIKGGDTGLKYDGQFKYKRLNYSAKNEAAKLTAQLNGDLSNLDRGVQAINFMLGILKYGLLESPDWWSESVFGLNLYDDNVVFEIYQKVEAFEEKWKREVWGTEPKKPKLKEKNDESKEESKSK